MLNLRRELSEAIRGGIKAAVEAEELPFVQDVDELEIVVEWPEEKMVKKNKEGESEVGDLASPVAMSLAKRLRRKPMEIVEAIASNMPKKEYMGRITATAPGYLNVRLNPGWMTARLDNVVGHDACTDVDRGKGQEVNLEFISANPTGPLTIGNCRSAFSVDTLGKVLSCAGYNVTREYYFNDAGGQVRKLGESVLRRSLQAAGERVEFPEELYQGEYVKALSVKIAEWWQENEGRGFSLEDLNNEEVLSQVSEQAVKEVFFQIKRTIKKGLGIEFDVWTSEKKIKEEGLVKEAMKILEEKGAVYEKDGTKWFKTSDYGDDKDRVLVKANGDYAYVAPDIGYHHSKYKRGFDYIFTVVGADHQGHLPKIKLAMELLGHDTGKLHQVVTQWLRLVKGGKTYKPSKRRGEVYGPKDLINEVGYDAVRFFFVMHRMNTHMDFDLDLAKEKSERNPVYYVQYAHVRLQSILRRAKQGGVIEGTGEKFEMSDSPKLTHTMEMALMKQLYRFPEIIDEVASDFEVHRLAYYAYDLAKAVHVFYRHVPVLVSDDEALVKNRLQLVLAARDVLAKTLDLLGISKPDVM